MRTAGRATAWTLVAALAATSAGTPLAFADEDQRVAAKALSDRARTKSTAGDHSAAAELYQQAYALAPLPLLLSNIGSEYALAKQPAQALDFFCRYLAADPNGANASYVTSQAQLAATALHRSTDEAQLCKPAAAPDQGSGSGSAAIAPPPPLPPVVVTPTEPAQPPPPPPARARHLELAGATVLAGGAVLATVGIVYGVKAQNLSNQISNQAGAWPTNINSLYDQGHTDQNLQIGFLVAGGVAIAAGATLFVIGHHAQSSESIAVAPILAPGTTGLAVGGAF